MLIECWSWRCCWSCDRFVGWGYIECSSWRCSWSCCWFLGWRLNGGPSLWLGLGPGLWVLWELGSGSCLVSLSPARLGLFLDFRLRLRFVLWIGAWGWVEVTSSSWPAKSRVGEGVPEAFAIPSPVIEFDPPWALPFGWLDGISSSSESETCALLFSLSLDLIEIDWGPFTCCRGGASSGIYLNHLRK